MGAANTSSYLFLSLILVLHIVMQSNYCTATDTISESQKISVGETINSAGQIFELGFFSPGNSSTKQYVGIWYKNISVRKVVWVANRERPLEVANSSGSSLAIGSDGNLRLVDGNQNIVWSTDISVYHVNNSVAVLLDEGNLVLNDGVSGESLWESFNYPCDTALPGMKIGLNTRTGEKLFLSSWKTEDDPTPGMFVAGITPEQPPQAFVRKGSSPFWRSGQWDHWDGFKMVGTPETHGTYLNGVNLIPQLQQDDHYFTFTLFNASDVRILTVTSTGSLRLIGWDEGTEEWITRWNTMESPCDIYGACGPFGVCDKNKSPICRCLKGFVPKSNKEWSEGNWTSGCSRKTGLFCNKTMRNLSSGSGNTDGFRKLRKVKGRKEQSSLSALQ